MPSESPVTLHFLAIVPHQLWSVCAEIRGFKTLKLFLTIKQPNISRFFPAFIVVAFFENIFQFLKVKIFASNFIVKADKNLKVAAREGINDIEKKTKL